MLVFICLHLKIAFDTSVWEPEKKSGDARLGRCRAFLPVQCAKFWGAVLVMQTNWPCHLGIDHNLIG